MKIMYPSLKSTLAAAPHRLSMRTQCVCERVRTYTCVGVCVRVCERAHMCVRTGMCVLRACVRI